MCAGAISVSWITGFPSAVIETHVVWSARIRRLKVLGAFPTSVGLLLLTETRSADPLIAAGLEDASAVEGGMDEEGADASALPTGTFAATEDGSIFGGTVGADAVMDEGMTGDAYVFVAAEADAVA